MTTTHTYHYRGYQIVPQRQWASWCVGIYATRANLPLMSQSTLRTLAPRMEEAVAEAKHSIDEALADMNDWLGNLWARCRVCSVMRSGSTSPLAQTQAADLAELLFGSFCVRSPGHPARGFFLFSLWRRSLRVCREPLSALLCTTAYPGPYSHRV